MTPRPAGLPMYDLPGVRAATDAWFEGLMRHIRAQGVDGVPAARTRPGAGELEAHWRAPNLLLSQTCGHPFAVSLKGRAQVVAAPVWALQGAERAEYHAVLITAADAPHQSPADLRGGTAAVNGVDSYSGFTALARMLAPFNGAGPLLESYFITGGHTESVRAAAEGRAGCAAVDAVTFALLQTHEPDLTARVRVLARGARAPALPLITSVLAPEAECAALRRAAPGAESRVRRCGPHRRAQNPAD